MKHQGLDARCPSVNVRPERVHILSMEVCHILRETCPLVLTIVDETREHHVTYDIDDKMDGSEQVMTATGKLHKRIVCSPVFPVSSLGNVVPSVFHITLEIVLKMFNMLVQYVKSHQDSPSNKPSNAESNKKCQEKSEKLLGRETEI